MRALILTLLLITTAAADPDNHDLVIPGKLAVEWVFHGEHRIWMSVNYSAKDFKEVGYHPNWTNIITKYKPITKKLSDGTYEITFTSDLTENLP